MNASIKDTRRHPRFNVDVAATVTGADGRKLNARTRDVSRAGICLITSTAVPDGEQLNVELVLAFGGTTYSQPLRLKAHVVWCTPIAQAFQIGAIFDVADEAQDNFLDMFLQYLDGTLAPRGVEAGDESGEVPLSPDEKDDPFRK